jgi:hypothetical protein
MTVTERTALHRRRQRRIIETLATTLERCVPFVAEKEPALAKYADALAGQTLQDLSRRP